MTENETERTAGGALGKLAGKVKEVAGEFAGDRDLAREGRLQDAASDAELDARRKNLEARVQAENARVEEEHAAVEEERKRLRAEINEEEVEKRAEEER